MSDIKSLNDESCKLEKSIILNSYFFAGRKTGKIINSNYLKHLTIEDMVFPAIIKNCLAFFPKINTLEDLINTDYGRFLSLPNCNLKVIKDAQELILYLIEIEKDISPDRYNDIVDNNYISNDDTPLDNHLESIADTVNNSYFFLGDIRGKKVILEDFKNILVQSINFTIRLSNNLKLFPNIKTLEDLLNMDYNILLKQPNFGIKTVTDNQRIILKYIYDHHLAINSSIDLNNPTHDLSKNKVIRPNNNFVSFLKPRNITFNEIDNNIMEKPLSEINFPVRFENYLSTNSHVSKVRDLLEIDPLYLRSRSNLGERTLNIVQKTMEEIILNSCTNINGTISESSIDSIIVNKINKVFENKRSYEIIIQRTSYNSTDFFTYKEIGSKYNISRERIRQIIERSEKLILNKKHIFNELFNAFHSYGYVINCKRFFTDLVKKNQWDKCNERFFYNIIKLLKNEIYFEDNFILTSNPVKLKPFFKEINKQTLDLVKDKRKGVPISEIISKIEIHNINIHKFDLSKILIYDTFEYLANRSKTYFIHDLILFNEMMDQICFGTILKNVVYWSLKYFIEPVHFTQIVEFIRQNNKNFIDVSNESVYSILVYYDYYHYIDRGIYALKGTNISKHLSAKEAILNVLEKKGALLENEIIGLLKSKYSVKNLKMALENSKNIFLKNGNNLFDIRKK